MNTAYLYHRIKQCADLVSLYTFLDLQNPVFDASEDMGMFSASAVITPEYLAINIEQMPLPKTVITLKKDLVMKSTDSCGCFVIGIVGSKPVGLQIKGRKAEGLQSTIPLPKNKLGSCVIFIIFPLKNGSLRKMRALESTIRNADTNPELIIQASKMRFLDFTVPPQ